MSKAIARTTSISPRRPRTKPILIINPENGKRELSKPVWADEPILEHLRLLKAGKWNTVGEIAKLVYRHDIEANRARVRRNMHKLWKHALISRDVLLVIETEGIHHRAKRVKVYDPSQLIEKRLVEAKIQRLKSSKELSETQYISAMRLVGVPDEEINELIGGSPDEADDQIGSLGEKG